MVRKADFNPDIPLPPGLTITAILKAIDYRLFGGKAVPANGD
jgi:hypothetical protein